MNINKIAMSTVTTIIMFLNPKWKSFIVQTNKKTNKKIVNMNKNYQDYLRN